VLHQKCDGIATLTTSKTFINFFGWGDGKRRRFFVVERAVTDIISASLL